MRKRAEGRICVIYTNTKQLNENTSGLLVNRPTSHCDFCQNIKYIHIIEGLW